MLGNHSRKAILPYKEKANTEKDKQTTATRGPVGELSEAYQEMVTVEAKIARTERVLHCENEENERGWGSAAAAGSA